MPLNLPPFLRVILLYPLSVLYGIGVSVRNALFDLKVLPSKSFEVPTICVGNITVGGTGKTPHVEYVIDTLSPEFKIATLSRGYKRKTNDFRIADKKSLVAEVGDEPLQIKRKYQDVTVAVDNKRVHGIEMLLEKQKDLNVVILDDAYQHRYVKPGLNILLIDYNRMITKDHLLPYGYLREKKSAKKRANVMIVTKCPGTLKPIERRLLRKELRPFPYQNLFYTTINYADPVPVFGQKKDNLSTKKLLLEKPDSFVFCGIANPEPFTGYVNRISTLQGEKYFPDHHPYQEADIKLILQNLDNKPKNTLVFTTEKDATRLVEMDAIPQALKKRLYYIPMKIDFLDHGAEKFTKVLHKYVKQNKRSGFIHPG